MYNVHPPAGPSPGDGTGHPRNAKIDSMKKAQHPPWTHGLCEAYVLDPDRYLWVPGVLLPRP